MIARIRQHWKKLALLLSLVALTQLPFIYRRFQLSRLHGAIAQLNASRAAPPKDFADYKGVLHVHSSLGGHSDGKLADIVKAAQANGLRFVAMTEHPQRELNTADFTLRGEQGGVLFINGNEVVTANRERFLALPGDASAHAADTLNTADALKQAQTRGALTFAAYPEEWQHLSAGGYDGIEIYNLYTNARQANPLVTFFDTLWAGHPELLVTRFAARPDANLQKFDELTARGARFVAVAGNDAHQNIGFGLADAGGHRWLHLQLDPYERSFRLFRTHIILPAGQPLTQENLYLSLRQGHCFTGFDVLGDTSGFLLTADNGAEQKLLGDEIALREGVRLKISLPIPARVALFRDGQRVNEAEGVLQQEFTAREKGAYRVECYLTQLQGAAGGFPWIISNPVYVR
jgi:hypothetical protein